MANKLVKVWKLGLMQYAKALQVQQYVAQQHHNKAREICDTLLLVEHSPVYTVGIRRKEYNEDDIEALKATGADFFCTNRGGLITFHGPGQLVVYPILNLKNYQPSMRWYVCHIEKTIIKLCEKLNLVANTSPLTGVWIKDNKVCAIGVHGSRYITTHGLALNCNVDLEWYKHIVPCGIKDKGVTSLSKETKRVVDIDSVIPLFLDSFKDLFGCSFVNYPESDQLDCIKKYT